MIDAATLIVRYQTYIFAALGALALVYLFALARARDRLSRTPFGLEREAALRRQNGALGGLTVLVLIAVSIYVMSELVLPEVLAPIPTPQATAVPSATPSPVAVREGVVVDSSGCENPNATLESPQPGERIVGSFEVRGTANIDNFAFYKFEISGAGTGGAWLSLGVGTEPRTAAELGRFDSSAREPGEYAFRLVVLDNAGNYPPPCVVPITILPLNVP
jgi:hypothetical protein